MQIYLNCRKKIKFYQARRMHYNGIIIANNVTSNKILLYFGYFEQDKHSTNPA